LSFQLEVREKQHWAVDVEGLALKFNLFCKIIKKLLLGHQSDFQEQENKDANQITIPY
jgi:hypothetical protein